MMRNYRNNVSARANTCLLFFPLMLLVLSVVGLAGKAKAELNPGDILVIDSQAGTDDRGVLFKVDPATGNRTILSDFGDGTKGTKGSLPRRVAIESTGQILVIDSEIDVPTEMNGGEGALFRVDPMTGNRTVLSDFGDANQGPTGIDPFGVAVESTGQILVSEQDGGNGECHALFRIDPVTGNRTILSDFGEGSMGDNQCDDGANDVAVESTKKILILFDAVLSGGVGLLYRVDQNTGDRVFLSDFRNDMGFTVGQSPRGVAVESNGQILATGIDDEDPGPDALFRIDPVTGVTTILSNFGNGSQGAINGIGWEGLAVEGNGTILVAARTSLNEAGARGKLYRVNPMNGNRTLLSDFNDGNQGPNGESPFGVTVVPPDTDGDGEFDNFDNCPNDA
ncbi:MAG: hypothetical protein L0Y56_23015, partial [Nitrospira sp.]|nr:hypothetical protein [Nitrospira sp.]